ncbi:MAG TPA: LLM class flavin-dependent oxidoreductase [Ktedonobacteraceae bacterium]|nr:LLM class flavin-dependent oxidoreductase [Ktedonobacteraceae bacterium]
MATIDFGLMLRQNDPGHSLDALMAYNQRCISVLSPDFTTLWLEDHLQVAGTDELECLTTLSFLAGAYPQFKLGSLVLSQSYRNPALLAKMAANLQALSHGRLILGIGTGWKEEEYHAYGYPFPSARTRLDELAEAVQILKAMWTTRPASFEGQHYSLKEAYCEPQPFVPIPLLIGGGGERRTLALVARYADWWNFNSCPLEEYAHKLDVLKQHCERIGRDFSEIRLTYLSTLSVSENADEVLRHPDKHYIAGNATEVTRELERFQAIGVTHFIFRIPNLANLEHFIAHVIPHFQS